MNMQELRTARLHLRAPVLADAPALAAALDDFEISRWLAPVPFPYTLSDAEWFIGEVTAGRMGALIIDDGEIAGVIGLDDGTLGYWLARRAQGQGYATEAAEAVVGWAFAQGLDRLLSGHFTDNSRSARVLEKLNFRPTGVEMLGCRARGGDFPSRRMALARADWLERKAAIR